MKRDSYQTLLVIVIGFLVLSYILPGISRYWVATATIIGLLGLMSFYLRNIILLIWNKLSLMLGWINSRIILSVVFIVFQIPLGFLYKLFNGDPLMLKSPTDQTAFKNRNHLYEKKDLENIW